MCNRQKIFGNKSQACRQLWNLRRCLSEAVKLRPLLDPPLARSACSSILKIVDLASTTKPISCFGSGFMISNIYNSMNFVWSCKDTEFHGNISTQQCQSPKSRPKPEPKSRHNTLTPHSEPCEPTLGPAAWVRASSAPVAAVSKPWLRQEVHKAGTTSPRLPRMLLGCSKRLEDRENAGRYARSAYVPPRTAWLYLRGSWAE